MLISKATRWMLCASAKAKPHCRRLCSSARVFSLGDNRYKLLARQVIRNTGSAALAVQRAASSASSDGVGPAHSAAATANSDNASATKNGKSRRSSSSGQFFPGLSKSNTAAVIASTPSRTEGSGSILNSGEWCPAMAGPPFFAALTHSGLVPPTAK